MTFRYFACTVGYACIYGVFFCSPVLSQVVGGLPGIPGSDGKSRVTIKPWPVRRTAQTGRLQAHVPLMPAEYFGACSGLPAAKAICAYGMRRRHHKCSTHIPARFALRAVSSSAATGIARPLNTDFPRGCFADTAQKRWSPVFSYSAGLLIPAQNAGVALRQLVHHRGVRPGGAPFLAYTFQYTRAGAVGLVHGNASGSSFRSLFRSFVAGNKGRAVPVHLLRF